jgi:tryptophan synthase alpha subunit
MNKSALMTHIVAGYPDIKISEELVKTMDKVGVSFIEIQIPFSDPVADGPTLMHAQKIALDNGITTERSFQMVKRLQKKIETPLLFMTYYNILHAYGVGKFCKRMAKLGMYGLIVPDIPIDEESSEKYIFYCQKYGIHPIQVISPLTPQERLKEIATVASGFVYCVSREGTTGVKKTLNPNLSEYIKKVKKYIQVPCALGFGISTDDQVKVTLRHVDIAVIGSAVVEIFNQALSNKKLEAVKKFINQITPQKIKICGVRNTKILDLCIKANIDYVGINFVSTSKRKASSQFLQKFPAKNREKTSFVGIFQNQPLEEVSNIVKKYSLDCVQLHGEENISYIQALHVPVIKGIALKNKNSVSSLKKYIGQVHTILLDGPAPGNGISSSSNLLDQAVNICRKKNQKFSIAGGINKNNITSFSQKYTDAEFFDIASGVEDTEGNFSKKKFVSLISKLS